MLSWQLKKFEELSPFELYSILALRQEVFIVEQNCAYPDADGKDLKSFHLMGMMNESKRESEVSSSSVNTNKFPLWESGGLAMIAYARIVFPGVSYKEVSIGRVVSSPKYRRTGIGKILMEEALTHIEKIYGKVPVRIGAQRYLLEFYKNFGFIPLENYIEDGIPHTIMLRS